VHHVGHLPRIITVCCKNHRTHTEIQRVEKNNMQIGYMLQKIDVWLPLFCNGFIVANADEYPLFNANKALRR
jgi:hypothetical protein